MVVDNTKAETKEFTAAEVIHDGAVYVLKYAVTGAESLTVTTTHLTRTKTGDGEHTQAISLEDLPKEVVEEILVQFGKTMRESALLLGDRNKLADDYAQLEALVEDDLIDGDHIVLDATANLILFRRFKVNERTYAAGSDGRLYRLEEGGIEAWLPVEDCDAEFETRRWKVEKHGYIQAVDGTLMPPPPMLRYVFDEVFADNMDHEVYVKFGKDRTTGEFVFFLPKQNVSGATVKTLPEGLSDFATRVHILGDIHSHPWKGRPSPSGTDNTDMAKRSGVYGITNIDGLMTWWAACGEALTQLEDVDVENLTETLEVVIETPGGVPYKECFLRPANTRRTPFDWENGRHFTEEWWEEVLNDTTKEWEALEALESAQEIVDGYVKRGWLPTPLKNLSEAVWHSLRLVDGMEKLGGIFAKKSPVGQFLLCKSSDVYPQQGDLVLQAQTGRIGRVVESSNSVFFDGRLLKDRKKAILKDLKSKRGAGETASRTFRNDDAQGNDELDARFGEGVGYEPSNEGEDGSAPIHSAIVKRGKNGGASGHKGPFTPHKNKGVSLLSDVILVSIRTDEGLKDLAMTRDRYQALKNNYGSLWDAREKSVTVLSGGSR